MERYHIRIDKISDKTIDHIKNWISKHDINTYLISEEIGSVTGKIHYQGFVDIDTSKRTEKAWRQNLKDSIHTTGRNQYSLTLKHGNIETYVCKDGNIILQSSDIHPLQIEQWKKDSYNNKKTESKKNTFCEKLVKHFSQIVPKPVSKEDYAYNVLYYFKDNVKVFDKFIIRRFVNLLMLLDSSDGDIYKLSRNIFLD